MLAIEIDGPHHLAQMEADLVRQKHVEAHGVRFLRFTDEEVIKNYLSILEVIGAEIDRLRRVKAERAWGSNSGC